MAASSGGSRGSGGIVRARKTKPPGRSWHRHRPSVGPGPLPVRGAIRQPGQRPSPPRPFSGGRRTGRGEGRCVGVETYRGLTGGIPVDDGEAVVRLSLPLVLPPLRERRGLARSAMARAKMPSTGGAMRNPEQSPPPPRPFSRGRRTGRGEGRCVGSGSCRGLTSGIPVDDGEAVVRLSLPLGLPPPRERRGLARSGTARPEMPSTGGAIRQPGQRPLPPSPFSGGRRTGRGDGDDLCVGVETCRGLTGGIPVDEGEALVTFPSLLFSLL